MANANTQGFGLRPAMRVGNTPAIQGQSKYEIDAGESNAIYNGEPVKVDISASTGGYIVTAAAGTAMVGTLNGVTFTDATTLKPTFSNFYKAATTAKQMRMVRIAEDVENQDQTAANCSVIVKVNLHQYLVGSLATGI